MNGDDRNTIRAVLDARVRERIGAFERDGERRSCAGCGGDHNERTEDCKVCWERHYKRARRADPVWRADDNYRSLLARHRRRQAAKRRASVRATL